MKTSSGLFRHLWVTFFLAVVLLAANILVLGPFMTRSFGDGIANAVYVIVRVIVIIGLSYWLSRSHHRSRFSALSLTSFAVFIEQVPVKLFLAPKDLSMDAVVYGLIVSYMVALPMVLLLAFLGFELSKRNVQKTAS